VHHSDRDPRPGDEALVICDRLSSPPFYPPRRLDVRDGVGALSVCL